MMLVSRTRVPDDAAGMGEVLHERSYALAYNVNWILSVIKYGSLWQNVVTLA